MIFHSYVSLPEGTTQPWELPMGQWVNQSDQRRAGSDICLRLGGHVNPCEHVTSSENGPRNLQVPHQSWKFEIWSPTWMQDADAIIHHPSSIIHQHSMLLNVTVLTVGQLVTSRKVFLITTPALLCASNSHRPHGLLWSPRSLGLRPSGAAGGKPQKAWYLPLQGWREPSLLTSTHQISSTHPWILVSKAHWNYLPLDMQ